NLVVEPRETRGIGGQRLGEELEGDRLSELQIVGPVDLPHPTTAEKRNDPVTAREERPRKELPLFDRTGGGGRIPPRIGPRGGYGEPRQIRAAVRTVPRRLGNLVRAGRATTHGPNLPPSAARAQGAPMLDLLAPHGQHDAKPRLPAHHALVTLGGALEREGLVHRPHPGARAERERILRVDRRPRVPPLDRAASGEKQNGRDLQRGS